MVGGLDIVWVGVKRGLREREGIGTWRKGGRGGGGGGCGVECGAEEEVGAVCVCMCVQWGWK